MHNEEILFVTTTLYTKWLDKQQEIIKNNFPYSEILIIDGTKNWPKVWFSWIEYLKKYTGIKWIIHIDEDCFIVNKQEIIKLIQHMDENGIEVCGVPDGFHQYRGANPIAVNSFFMVINFEKMRSLEQHLNLPALQFSYDAKNGWLNNLGVRFDQGELSGYKYNFEAAGNGANYNFEQEPYYYLMWQMKKHGFRFDYLYPFFDERYKSTNPRLSEDSPDMAIHMWYVRQWNTKMDVWGIPNIDRYKLVENNLYL